MLPWIDRVPSHNIEAALGFKIRHPRLAVLIGRESCEDAEALNDEQAREPDVGIVTDDELLEQQRMYLARQPRY